MEENKFIQKLQKKIAKHRIITSGSYLQKLAAGFGMWKNSVSGVTMFTCVPVAMRWLFFLTSDLFLSVIKVLILIVKLKILLLHDPHRKEQRLMSQHSKKLD